MVKLEQIIASVLNIAISAPLHHSNAIRSKLVFPSSLPIKLSSKVMCLPSTSKEWLTVYILLKFLHLLQFLISFHLCLEHQIKKVICCPHLIKNTLCIWRKLVVGLHLGYHKIVGRLWIRDSKFEEINLFRKLWYVRYVAGLSGFGVYLCFGVYFKHHLSTFPKGSMLK